MNPPRYPPLVQKMLDDFSKMEIPKGIQEADWVEMMPPTFTREEVKRMHESFYKAVNEEHNRVQFWKAVCYVLAFVILLIIFCHFFL